MVNTPIPHSLKSEAKKAAKILREFTMPNAKTGPDKLIPAGIFAKAKGLAIITVFKAGFLVTARGGSGIVVAKLGDSLDYASGWSAPSAIGLAGLGGGFEIGAEVTDFVIILNTRAAVDAFSKGGNLTLGGNFTVAAGPLGRNIEGDVAVRSTAAIYTYSKTKGLFAGISVEGSALIERKDANKKFYGRDIRASQILNGDVDAPEQCQALYDVMREHQEFAARAALKIAKNQAMKHRDEIEDRASSELSQRYGISKNSWRSKSTKSKHSSPSLSQKPSRSSSEWHLSQTSTSSAASKHTSTSPLGSSSFSEKDNKSYRRQSMPLAEDGWSGTGNVMVLSRTRRSSDEGLWVVADFTFQGELSCDLPFCAGDRLKVTANTDSQQDWWEGIDKMGNHGIFPANYVHVVS